MSIGTVRGTVTATVPYFPAGAFDAARVRLLRAESHQGVHYLKGVWHHFLLVLDESDFLVIDRTGPGDNCEEIALAAADEIRVRQ